MKKFLFKLFWRRTLKEFDIVEIIRVKKWNVAKVKNNWGTEMTITLPKLEKK